MVVVLEWCCQGDGIAQYFGWREFIQLKKSYNVVARLKANTSGFSWSETGGLNITINEAYAWNEYIVVRTVGCVSPVFH